MKQLHESIKVFKKALEKGEVQFAYQGLMQFIMNLKTDLKKKHPGYHVSGSIYQGYMDMTYFSFFPESFKRLKLKAGIVFNYDAFRFEAWLFGVNKQVQKEYWDFFTDKGWKSYPLVETTKGSDAIMEHVLDENPEFNDLADLAERLETGTLTFIKDIENFLIIHNT